MANKPFFNKTFLGIYRSTALDYPPKDKQIYRADSFLEGEHFNKGNYQQLPLGQGEDRCAGRVLKPAQQVGWGCGDQLKGGEAKTYQTKVSGAVGELTYTMDPMWSNVNEAGDKATIDANGVITLEDNVCQGPYPPWIIYFVCDECGCSQGTIWLEDCSADCSDCAGADCGAGLAVSGSDDIAVSTSEQYALDNAQGPVAWTYSGEVGTGGGISSNGLLTVDSVANGACGTVTVTATDSCCGTYSKNVRVTGAGAGFWNDLFPYPWDHLECGCPTGCSEILNGFKHNYCYNGVCHDTPLDEDTACSTTVTTSGCGCTAGFPYIYVTLHKIAEWICIP